MDKVFAIFDSKVELFDKPNLCKSRGEAMRMFKDLVNESGNVINKHPEDFTLFELGEYDSEKGKLIAHPTPVSCGVAIEYKEQSQ